MPTQTLPPGFPPELEQLAPEIHTYFRELPRLLEESEEGKVVVVKGTKTFGVWDTYADAIRYGHTLFPDGQFLAQEIDHRFLDAFGAHFATPEAGAA